MKVQDSNKIDAVVEFVNNLLGPVMCNSEWVNLSNESWFDHLRNNFVIYCRKRSLHQAGININSDFTNYDSLAMIRDDNPALVVAYDSEWMNIYNDAKMTRFILSWQFAYISEECINEIIILPKSRNKRLSLPDALSVVYSLYDAAHEKHSLDIRNVRKYKVTVNGEKLLFDTKQEAKKFSTVITDMDTVDKDDYIPICLLCHTGLVDLTAFETKGLRKVLKQLSSIHKGMVSLKNIKLHADLLDNKYIRNHKHIYPFSLIVRDTLCHAPADQRRLKDLGEAISFNKVALEGNWIERMDELLISNPKLYFEYASTDSVVTLAYSACLYGANMVPPVTLTSAAAKVLQANISEYLDIVTKDEFNLVYRGLRKVNRGSVETDSCGIGFIKAASLEPCNLDSKFILEAASSAYHGGYNGCSDVGYYEEISYDYDLHNAYPTSMVLIPDIDYEAPIKETLTDISLDELGAKYFQNDDPMQLMLAYIDSFAFPEDTAYPCFVLMVKGVPCYPLEYDSKSPSCRDVDLLCVTGPELYLAYKLGCKAKISKLYVMNPLELEEQTEDGANTIISHSLADGVKQFVADRALAKAYAKDNKIKNSISDKILKTMVNACYGKIAQNVIPKKNWDAYSEQMNVSTPSPISNPVSAAFITSIVRCVLISTLNHCVNNGYKVYSVTTDGFISTVPEDKLKAMPLDGFTKLLNKSRLFLTDNQSPDIWEIKHAQSNLLNATTRGNISLDSGGVCAHCGVHSEYEKGSIEDRIWFETSILKRNKKVPYTINIWASFKEIIEGLVIDFCVTPKERAQSLDFDCKRKPIRESIYTAKPVIEGTEYEIACFSTAPYKDVKEFKLYQSVRESIVGKRKNSPSRSLRTKRDWEYNFFKKIDKHSKNRTLGIPKKKKVENPSINGSAVKLGKVYIPGESKIDRKIRFTIYAHKAGVISIPILENYTVREFCRALNSLHLSRNRFTPEKIKNYNKRENWPAELTSDDTDVINDFLKELEPVYSKIMNLQPIIPDDDV